jgi:hypothetical protein
VPQVQCQYCGLPFNVRRVEPGRRYFCCSGCALVSRLPPGGVEGRYPVVPALIEGLAVGVVFFNELLFWSLGLEVAREGRLETAQTLTLISVGLGAAVWLGLTVGLWSAARRRWNDVLLTATTGVLVGLAFWPPLSAGWIVAANAALALWVVRGRGKKKLAPKASIPV